MKKNNITDFENYKDNMMSDMSGIENIDDNMMNAYLQAADIDTPDMWGRIEAGFEEEVRSSGVTQVTENVYVTSNRSKYRKIFGFVAAGVLLTVIAIPLLMNGVIGDKGCKGEMMTTEAQNFDMAKEEGAQDMAEGTECAAEEMMDDTQSSVYSDVEESGAAESDTLTNSQSAEVMDERKLVIQGEPIKLEKNIVGYGIVVEDVITNEYDEYAIEVGEVVVVSSTLVLEDMYDTIQKCEVQLENVYVNEYGRRQGKITDIEIIEYRFGTNP